MSAEEFLAMHYNFEEKFKSLPYQPPVCPIDPTHPVDSEDFYDHLDECRRIHKDVSVLKCFFHPWHYYRQDEPECHYVKCKFRPLYPVLVTYLLKKQDDREVGRPPMPLKRVKPVLSAADSTEPNTDDEDDAVGSINTPLTNWGPLKVPIPMDEVVLWKFCGYKMAPYKEDVVWEGLNLVYTPAAKEKVFGAGYRFKGRH